MDCCTKAAVVALVAAVMFPGGMVGQVTSQPSKIPSCATIHQTGQKIISNFDIVEFSIPRPGHVTKVTDIDYEEYYVRFGPKQDKIWMNIMFGPLVGGFEPRDLRNASITWTSHNWGCHDDKDGTDWRGVGANGRKWRHVSIPFGFAAYEGVPAGAAEFFDRILDSMCCGKCPTCKK